MPLSFNFSVPKKQFLLKKDYAIGGGGFKISYQGIEQKMILLSYMTIFNENWEL